MCLCVVSIIAPSGVTPFKGYFIQARISTNSFPVGTWKVTEITTQKTITCTNASDALTQSNATAKTQAEMDWIAPVDNPPQQIIF